MKLSNLLLFAGLLLITTSIVIYSSDRSGQVTLKVADPDSLVATTSGVYQNIPVNIVNDTGTLTRLVGTNVC